MNNIRKILNVKFIMVIFLATLFILATSIMQAQASGFSLAKCPCKFWSALGFAKNVAAKIDGSFKIEECTDDVDEIEASGPTNDANGLTNEAIDCRIEFEAEDDDNSDFECGYEFQCGVVGVDNHGEIDVEDNSFALALDLIDLTEAEFEACRQEIKFISKFIFKVPCVESNNDH